MGIDRKGLPTWNHNTKLFIRNCIKCKKATSNKYFCSYKCMKLDTQEKLPNPLLCKCGCGNYAKPKNMFIYGHQNRGIYSSRFGKPNPMKGKIGHKNPTLSELNKRKTGSKNPMYNRFGANHPAYNHKKSDNFKKAQRVRILQYWEKGILFPYWKETKPELCFEKLLQEAHIKHIKQYKIGIKFADFYLIDFNQIVEIDGCWAHGCREHSPTSPNKDRFQDRLEYFKDKGFYNCIQIWEHNLKEMSIVVP